MFRALSVILAGGVVTAFASSVVAAPVFTFNGDNRPVTFAGISVSGVNYSGTLTLGAEIDGTTLSNGGILPAGNVAAFLAQYTSDLNATGVTPGSFTFLHFVTGDSGAQYTGIPIDSGGSTYSVGSGFTTNDVGAGTQTNKALILGSV